MAESGAHPEAALGKHKSTFLRSIECQAPEPTGEPEEPEVRLAQQQTVWDEPKTVHRITTGHAR